MYSLLAYSLCVCVGSRYKYVCFILGCAQDFLVYENVICLPLLGWDNIGPWFYMFRFIYPNNCALVFAIASLIRCTVWNKLDRVLHLLCSRTCINQHIIVAVLIAVVVLIGDGVLWRNHLRSRRQHKTDLNVCINFSRYEFVCKMRIARKRHEFGCGTDALATYCTQTTEAKNRDFGL